MRKRKRPYACRGCATGIAVQGTGLCTTCLREYQGHPIIPEEPFHLPALGMIGGQIIA